jgi:hypothetical protein
MSVAEIKEEMRRMTSSELADIEKLAVELQRGSETRVREVQSSDADLQPAMDAVFDKHRDLLRRLAQ